MTTMLAAKGIFALSGQDAVLRKRGLIALALKVTFVGRRAPSASCDPQTSQIWFPVLPGTTVLPEGDEPVVNEVPLPPNAATLPEGFDPYNPDLCLLFQDILPVNSEPVYPVEQTTDYLALPFSELISAVGIVRTKLAIQRLDYALQLDARTVPLVTRLAIAIINKQLASGAGSYILEFATSAILNYLRTLKGRAGQFVLGRPEAGFSYDRAIVASVGVFTLSGSDAKLIQTYPDLAADVGSFTLQGQDAVFFKFRGLIASPGSFTLSGQNSSLRATRILPAATGAYTFSGIDATLTKIAQPLMKVLLYTGNGSTNARTGAGFEPGLVWTKRRTTTIADHAIYDYVQGTTKYWRSNQSAAQVTDANSLTAFGSDGFTLGSAAISNTSSASYVAWCLTKGGAGSSNTNGSITTTVYANNNVGYNIFTYTGTGANATVGHGLGASPELVIIRNLSTAQSTAVGGDFLANNEYIFMGTTAKASSTAVFQAYSSTTISIGANASVNNSGNSMLGYAFKSVAGNTDIGTYTGTGTTNQSITCGFAPQFVLIKAYSTTGSWMMFDNTRGVTLQLAMGENSVESTVDKVTLDSNGFTVKANQNTNTNAVSYVYWAVR